MKKIAFLALLVTSFLLCQAQTDSSQIALKNKITLNGNMWKGVKYSYSGSNNVDIRKIRTMLNIDNQNATFIKQAQCAKIIGRVTAVTGGICLGFGINDILGGGKFNVPLMAIGGGLIGVSIPISSLSVSKMRKAVNRYNAK
jgi:hypothetical protein